MEVLAGLYRSHEIEVKFYFSMATFHTTMSYVAVAHNINNFTVTYV